MNYRLFYFFLFCFSLCSSQQKENTEIDSLSQLSYEILIDSFYNTSKLQRQETFAKSILRKAKQQKDTALIKTAYYIHSEAYHENEDLAIAYLDSLINISKSDSDYNFLSLAYHRKGDILHQKRNFKDAINAFINSNNYAQKLNDVRLIFSSNYYIGRLKDRIGNHKEAIEIHQNNTTFAKKNIDSIGKYLYLNSVFALAFAHKNLKNIDSASYYNKLGLKLSDEFKIKSVKPYFTINEGVVSYFRREYDVAKLNIEKAKDYFEKQNDLPNLSEAYFYLGKIAYDQKNIEEAIYYFKKVDTIFTQINDLLPELRENYILLSKYYNQKKDINQQLVYTEKLIEIDSILNSNYIYISGYLKNEYDIPNITSEKEGLILALENTNKTKTTYIYVAIASILLIITLFYRRQQIFKKRFEKLLLDTKETAKTTAVEIQHTVKEKSLLEVPQEIAKNILEGLTDFEKKNGFLDANIKLVSLAKLLQTNTNYLSKTINHYKENNINVYLNDLRADYAIKRLKEDSKFRNYTIKAIAKDVGFKSSETFSKTFYKKTGIYPSYFIKQIEKKK